jgi:peptidylprolyl isomerase
VNKILMASAGTVLLLSVAACGQQTDERVSSASTPAASAPASAPAATSAASAVAAATPFVSLDCVSLQAMPTDAPPSGATTVGSASAIFQPNGAPAITIATDAQPATELGYADIKVGTGPEVTATDTVTVDYCGVGLGGKTVFDSSWTRGQPATFPLSNLIPGWQQGIPGMQVGGQRLLVIPGALGYGEQGTTGIAPNETLVFVIQLDSIG